MSSIFSRPEFNEDSKRDARILVGIGVIVIIVIIGIVVSSARREPPTVFQSPRNVLYEVPASEVDVLKEKGVQFSTQWLELLTSSSVDEFETRHKKLINMIPTQNSFYEKIKNTTFTVPADEQPSFSYLSSEWSDFPYLYTDSPVLKVYFLKDNNNSNQEGVVVVLSLKLKAPTSGAEDLSWEISGLSMGSFDVQ